MSIRKKIIGGFLLIFLIGLILGTVGLISSRSLTAKSDELYVLQGSSSSVSNVLNAHYIWRQTLTQAVLNMQPFAGSLNPDTCALGQWRNSDEAKGETDSEILSLLNQLDKPHSYIHNEAAAIVTFIDEGNQVEARRKLVEDILPETEQAISILTAMTDRYGVLLEQKSTATVEYGTRTNLILIVLIVAALAISFLIAFLILQSIMKPIQMITHAAETISQGDLDVNIRYTVNDEIGELAESFRHMIDATRKQVAAAEALADGDLTIAVTARSAKDAMNIALRRMIDKLEAMFSEINASTAQVSAGSRQLADGSQTLAQGSTEQAAAIEQLSSSIAAIAQKTEFNAEIAGKAATLADEIKSSAEKGNHQMDEMVSAVREINQASQSINKVIKVIDDIAFQTNILALNASVEAARAGQHGKGFAVVAEEVRNLAAKSAEAAKDTGGLILSSIEKAELGARIADETALSLAHIVTGINESSQLVRTIASSSDEQAAGVAQINKGIDQVAQVVQQNSATAEQSAAASEEMSSQASMLESLMSQFKLSHTSEHAFRLPSAEGPHGQAGLPEHRRGDYGEF